VDRFNTPRYALVPNQIRKQVVAACKSKTSLGQSVKTHKLHLGSSIHPSWGEIELSTTSRFIAIKDSRNV
jgi:hypothetical protein